MKHLTVINTFLSRILVLALNFGLVIYSTQVWGISGKGIISIVIANLALISFVSNVFVGSSTSYFASKYRKEEILSFAYIWSFLIGVTLPCIFFIFTKSEYTYYLILLSIFFSLYTANINFFVGKKDMYRYNLYTLLQQLLHILFIFFIIVFLHQNHVEVYFKALIFCYVLLFLVSFFQVFNVSKFSELHFSSSLLQDMFHYGWKTQLSAFVQFLNYRLSYYFLEYFKGIASVGVFSVGVAFSEAIWTVSRSLSVILYSDVVNSKNHQDSIEKTKISLRISFLITLVSLIAILIIPAQVYVFIFGKDFNQTKQIILLLSPGILAIAVSNIIGHYFAGVNQLLILNIKSIIGLVFMIISSFCFIPKWGILGACIVTTISYCLSSAILFWKFYQITTFRVSDFILSKSEINLLLQKFSVKNNS